jgi:hypothetical protein
MKNGDYLHVKFAGLLLAAGVAAVILAGGAMILCVPQPAQATPQFAAKTGMPCGQCHVSPSGGAALKAFGKQFKANGNKLPKKK